MLYSGLSSDTNESISELNLEIGALPDSWDTFN